MRKRAAPAPTAPPRPSLCQGDAADTPTHIYCLKGATNALMTVAKRIAVDSEGDALLLGPTIEIEIPLVFTASH